MIVSANACSIASSSVGSAAYASSRVSRSATGKADATRAATPRTDVRCRNPRRDSSLCHGPSIRYGQRVNTAYSAANASGQLVQLLRELEVLFGDAVLRMADQRHA